MPGLLKITLLVALVASIDAGSSGSSSSGELDLNGILAGFAKRSGSSSGGGRGLNIDMLLQLFNSLAAAAAAGAPGGAAVAPLPAVAPAAPAAPAPAAPSFLSSLLSPFTKRSGSSSFDFDANLDKSLELLDNVLGMFGIKPDAIAAFMNTLLQSFNQKRSASSGSGEAIDFSAALPALQSLIAGLPAASQQLILQLFNNLF